MFKILNQAFNDLAYSKLVKEIKASLPKRVNYLDAVARDLIYSPHGHNFQINPAAWYLVFFRPPVNSFLGSQVECPNRAYLFKDIKIAYTAAASIYHNTDGHGYPASLNGNCFLIEIVHPSDVLMFPEIKELVLFTKKSIK